MVVPSPHLMVPTSCWPGRKNGILTQGLSDTMEISGVKGVFWYLTAVTLIKIEFESWTHCAEIPWCAA